MAEQKRNYKKIALFVFYGALTVAILVTILSFNDIGDIFSVIGTADVKYIWIGIAFLAAYAMLYPLTTCILAKAQKLPTSFKTTYTIAMTEHFFNGITPFSTGGQPFQVYAFKKAGVKLSDSTGLLMMNFIIFMMVTNLYALLSLIYATRFVTTVPMTVLAVVGFTINFGVLVFLIALATSRRLRNGLLAIVDLLCRVKFLKRFLEPRKEQINNYFEQVQSAFKTLLKKVWVFILCILIKIVTMAFYYAITFYILRALGVPVGYGDMFFIICGTSFAITMVVFVPTPGSSGGIEFAFNSVLANIGGGLASSVSYGGMLIWRLLSYYLMMGISLLFYIILEISFSVRAKRIKAAQTTCGGAPIALGADTASEDGEEPDSALSAPPAGEDGADTEEEPADSGEEKIPEN